MLSVWKQNLLLLLVGPCRYLLLRKLPAHRVDSASTVGLCTPSNCRYHVRIVLSVAELLKLSRWLLATQALLVLLLPQLVLLLVYHLDTELHHVEFIFQIGQLSFIFLLLRGHLDLSLGALRLKLLYLLHVFSLDLLSWFL